jgi:predicted Zn-ribbon and HTH transcriptional regulator
MKIQTLIRFTMAVIMLCIVMITTGCQTPGQVVSSKKSGTCPTCKNQTVTTPIKGLKYSRHVCPDCKTVYITDPSVTNDELAGYGGWFTYARVARH